MDNNYTDRLDYSLDHVKVRPYDRSSKIFYEDPGTEHFDDRSDFALLRNQLGLGVLLTISNLNKPKGHRCSMAVTLIDTDADSAIWSGMVNHRFAPGSEKADIRVDIPLPYLHTIPTHTYCVRVDDRATGDSLNRKALRFYDLPQIKVLPTKWVLPLTGHISPFDEWVEVSFSVGLSCKAVEPRLPEVEIWLHLPDGNINKMFAKLEEEENGRYEVSRYVKRGVLPEGIAFAELRCMGHAVTGFLFDCSVLDKGMQSFGIDQMHTFQNYTPERAKSKHADIFRIGSTEESQHMQAEEKTADNDNEEFTRLLDEFISSNLADSDEVSDSVSTKHPALPANEISPSPMEMLDRLTGLADVKRKVAEYADLAHFTRLRQEAGLPMVAPPLHCMFFGSPGTGKTTVAKIMGTILKDAGILSSGHVVVKERATLLGQNYNSEAEKTLEAIEEAKGGILFIDEAYQLHQPKDPRDPGKFVIETLMTALADESRRDWMLILAGYPEPTRRLLDMNPGLASRIPISNHYNFDDFSPDELMEIAVNYLTANSFTLSSEADTALRGVIAEDYVNRPDNFGNGRYVINLLQTRVIQSAASRIVKLGETTPEILSRIEASDIPAPEFEKRARQHTLGFRA